MVQHSSPEVGRSLDQLTADVIHAVRAAGIVPSRPFSAGQWTMVVKAMLDMGWRPPAHSDEVLRGEFIKRDGTKGTHYHLSHSDEGSDA